MALLLAIILAVVIYLRGATPFSPGPLNAQASGPALDGYASHAAFATECEQCHAPWQGITAERCERCHTDVTRQRAANNGLHGQLGDSERCERCHTEHKGNEAQLTLVSGDIFPHDAVTSFSLAQHQTDFDGEPLDCKQCHGSTGYEATQVDCISCHAMADPIFMDEHRALFGDDCVSCHDGVDTMAAFDHALAFPLEEAHSELACAACHIQGRFAGTPDQCVGCHEEPALHKGQFGLDCVRCHSTVAWTPARLTEHTFPLDHGNEGALACQVCHEQTYAVYTCYNCHEHQPDEIREEHVDEGILAFDDCATCHPTGREDEVEGHDD